MDQEQRNGLSAAPYVAGPPDKAAPASSAAQTGSSPPRPARWRSRRLAALVAALVTLAVATFFIARTVSSTPRTTSNTAAATWRCRSALAAADQTLVYGARVATQIRAHAGIMKSMPQMISMGRASLIAGAAAAAKYEDRLAVYASLSEKCFSNGVSIQECKAGVLAANQALLYASNVETALNQHTAVMTRWDAGQLTADQAHHLGRPSLDTGLTEANALDQSMRNYRQHTGNC